MAKSIESIWKEGFLDKDALVAPVVNDLYNQKSEHIIEKFKRMFRINLIAIVVGSLLFLGITFLLKVPIMGILFFLTCIAVVIVNRRLLRELEQIDKSVSSFQYLKTFDNWMKAKCSINARMARFYYPMFFLSVVLGFWFSAGGQALFHEIINNPNQIFLVYGIPVFWVLGVILVSALLGFFGNRLYMLDLNIVYGRVLKKLDELLADMEELRAE